MFPSFLTRSQRCAVGLSLAAGCLPASFDDLTSPTSDRTHCDAGDLDAGCGQPADASVACDACTADAGDPPIDAAVTPSCAAPECELGATDMQMAACGACGTGTLTRTRSCDADGCWQPFVDGACTGVTAACTPADTTACENGDSCGQRVCSDACTWGACEPIMPDGCLRIRAGHTDQGSNYRCCGDMQWQFCLPDCTWSVDCRACTNCSDC
jgi:hypothetical protein